MDQGFLGCLLQKEAANDASQSQRALMAVTFDISKLRIQGALNLATYLIIEGLSE